MLGVVMEIYWKVCSGGRQFLAAHNTITSRGVNMPMWVVREGSCRPLMRVPAWLLYARGREGSHVLFDRPLWLLTSRAPSAAKCYIKFSSGRPFRFRTDVSKDFGVCNFSRRTFGAF